MKRERQPATVEAEDSEELDQQQQLEEFYKAVEAFEDKPRIHIPIKVLADPDIKCTCPSEHNWCRRLWGSDKVLVAHFGCQTSAAFARFFDLSKDEDAPYFRRLILKPF